MVSAPIELANDPHRRRDYRRRPLRPYELQKHGVHTHILETRAAPGGRVATTDYGNGLLAEYGIQEIWANNPLIKIAEELGVDTGIGIRALSAFDFHARQQNLS